MQKYTSLRLASFIVICLFLYIQNGLAQLNIPANNKVLVLKNVTIIDGTGAEPIQNQMIIIREGKISDILDTDTSAIPEDATLLDYTGSYVIPGFIDSKVHLARYPLGEDRNEKIKEVLEKALYRGVTSVRDLGGDTRDLAVLKRDAKVGEIISPDIYYSAMVAGASFFDFYPAVQSGALGGVAGEMPWLRAVSNKTDIRQITAEAKGTGASAIMIFADLSPDLIYEITKEAHRQNLQVWAQSAVYPAGPKEVIGAGVDVVTHITGFFSVTFDEIPLTFGERKSRKLNLAPADLDVNHPKIAPLIEQMKEKGTVFDPIVWRPYFNTDSSEESRSQIKLYCGYAQAAKKAGVPTSVGTSQGHLIRVAEATELLVTECGFTPLEAIRAATLHGAMAIGNEQTQGSLEFGKQANLIVLRTDPTEDIGNIKDIVVVLKNGRVYDPEDRESGKSK